MKTDALGLYSKREYRSDIQGIRAISAFLILVYHIWLHRVSGGVDVFFVLSGYVMTSMLLAQIAAEGRFSLLRFWGGILGRVAPTALLIIVLTLIGSYFFLPEPLWTASLREGLASSFFVQNLQLMKSSVDYLAREEPPSPYQHFWALSIQFQFYLLLGLVLLFITKAVDTTKTISSFLLISLAILSASFVHSVVETAGNPESAYFSPMTRSWEFFAGVITAILLPHVRFAVVLRTLAGLVGLAALLSIGLVVPREMAYPGFVALLPVSAAILLLISGARGEATVVSRALANRYLVALGGVSFSIYLWHWPILIFYQEHTGSAAVALLPGLAIIAGSVLFAFASKYLVELPLKRASDGRSPWVPYGLYVGFLVPALALGIVWLANIRDIQRQASSTEWSVTQHQYQEGEVVGEGVFTISRAELLTATKMQPQGCQQTRSHANVMACELGAVESPTIVAVVGGSHATQWLPALVDIGKRRNIRIVGITKGACPFGRVPEGNESCMKWNEGVIAFLADLRPDAVITNSSRMRDQQEHVPEGYVEQWQRLAVMGIKVIGIRDNPEFQFPVAACVARNRDNPGVCAVPKEVFYPGPDPASRHVAELENLRLIDATDWFCNDDSCPAASAGYLMYRDQHHLSVSYVRYLTSALERRLGDVAPEIFLGDGRNLGYQAPK